MSEKSIEINRAPVLTLWGVVVAEQLGHEHETALTLGKALAGLNAQSKGRMLGIYGTPKAPDSGGPAKKVGLGEEFWIPVCGRSIPAKNTEDGVRAVVKDKSVDPGKVTKYLESKFGDALDAVRDEMTMLASSFKSDQLTEAAYSLYERFRPQIPPGKRGWGQKGTLDLDLIRSLRAKAP